jgi:5'-AMP-activated protein kinase catalytic alpha subunit
VRHPHLIQLYEVVETPRYLFLVMEYCPGGELFDYIAKHQRLDQSEACRFFHQILQGVEYLHGLSIVHRDLKPENMLLDHRGRIKVVDFGLSNTYSRLPDGIEQLKTACGSPCYAAPEMIAGKKYSGLGVDLWSAGVVLFAMLTGNLPFEDPNTSHLYKKILALNYKIPADLSPEARSMIRGLLTTCDKRLGLAQIKAHPFYQLVEPQGDRGLRVGIDCIPVDDMVLGEMPGLGFDRETTRRCIEANRHNAAATAYHLLMKQKLQQGFHSHADINSDNFDARLKAAIPNPEQSTNSSTNLKNLIDSQVEQEDRPRHRPKKTALGTPRETSYRGRRLRASLEKGLLNSSLDSHARVSLEGRLLALPDITKVARKKVRM